MEGEMVRNVGQPGLVTGSICAGSLNHTLHPAARQDLIAGGCIRIGINSILFGAANLRSTQ